MLSRVNQLGTATAFLFGRLYHGLSRRQQIEQGRELAERNEGLREALRVRDRELDHLHGIIAAIEEGVVMQDLGSVHEARLRP